MVANRPAVEVVRARYAKSVGGPTDQEAPAYGSTTIETICNVLSMFTIVDIGIEQYYLQLRHIEWNIPCVITQHAKHCSSVTIHRPLPARARGTNRRVSRKDLRLFRLSTLHQTRLASAKGPA
jgi:hypothetical protein